MTLALNISGCPNRCKGCHSPHLQESVGEMLDEDALDALLGDYGDSVTCVCFMGGDASPGEVERLALFVRDKSAGRLKVGWYSGRADFPSACSVANFDYLKLGSYVEKLGGLDSPATNQRFYAVRQGELTDMTHVFQR